MSGPDMIPAERLVESLDKHPDGGDVVRLRERAENTVEAQDRQRLVELRLIGSESERSFNAASRACPEALDAFIRGLAPGGKLALAFAFSEGGGFSLHTEFSVTGLDRQEAADALRDLRLGFDSALAAAGLEFRFVDESRADQQNWPIAWQAEIRPPGLQVSASARAGGHLRSRQSPQLVAGRDASIERHGIVIAQPRVEPFASLDAMLRSLAAARCPLRLIVTLRQRMFHAEELRLLNALYERSGVVDSFARTDGLPPANAYEFARPVEALLRGFRREGRATEVSVRVEAARALPNATLSLTAGLFWGAHRASIEHHSSERDWRNLLPLDCRLPQWLPSSFALEELRTPVVRRLPYRESCDGTLLGKTTDGDEVRISESARERHIYCCGATGSGKSTLVANIVLQDIAAGRGLILVDPHGDITSDVLARVPLHAAKRVVALDMADPDHAAGLNVFDVRGIDPKMAKALVCGELLRIFKYELFPDVPEAFGPMFELYYRNALMLVLSAESPTAATLVDVPRVFQDPDYRKTLVERCPDRHVRDFWKKTADRVTHDEIELENVAPYIVAKFEPFLGSRAIRTILGQGVTTLDFGGLMDDGRAVLISLAKGLLGANEARVLGLLLLQQIQIACMARAGRPKNERRPCTLYIDEAQSFIGGALTELLAEARKFGLSLVLANQTMAQLSGRTSRALIDVVLGNVANLIVLRVGVRDAELLAPWFRPHLAMNDLVGMPDFTAAARVLEGRRPGVPVLVNLPPLSPVSEPNSAQTIVDESRAGYCRRRDEVEAELDAR